MLSGLIAAAIVLCSASVAGYLVGWNTAGQWRPHLKRRPLATPVATFWRCKKKAGAEHCHLYPKGLEFLGEVTKQLDQGIPLRCDRWRLWVEPALCPLLVIET